MPLPTNDIIHSGLQGSNAGAMGPGECRHRGNTVLLPACHLGSKGVISGMKRSQGKQWNNNVSIISDYLEIMNASMRQQAWGRREMK